MAKLTHLPTSRPVALRGNHRLLVAALLVVLRDRRRGPLVRLPATAASAPSPRRSARTARSSPTPPTIPNWLTTVPSCSICSRPWPARRPSTGAPTPRSAPGTGSPSRSLDGIQRVTELDMDGQGLNGTIPAQLGELTGLRELRLAWGNQLTGSIPAATGTAHPPHLPQPGRQPSVRFDPARAGFDRPATHPPGPQRTAALAERGRADRFDPGATRQPLRSDIPLPRRQSSDRLDPAATRPAAQAELVAA